MKRAAHPPRAIAAALTVAPTLRSTVVPTSDSSGLFTYVPGKPPTAGLKGGHGIKG